MKTDLLLLFFVERTKTAQKAIKGIKLYQVVFLIIATSFNASKAK